MIALFNSWLWLSSISSTPCWTLFEPLRADARPCFSKNTRRFPCLGRSSTTWDGTWSFPCCGCPPTASRISWIYSHSLIWAWLYGTRLHSSVHLASGRSTQLFPPQFPRCSATKDRVRSRKRLCLRCTFARSEVLSGRSWLPSWEWLHDRVEPGPRRRI